MEEQNESWGIYDVLEVVSAGQTRDLSLLEEDDDVVSAEKLEVLQDQNFIFLMGVRKYVELLVGAFQTLHKVLEEENGGQFHDFAVVLDRAAMKRGETFQDLTAVIEDLKQKLLEISTELVAEKKFLFDEKKKILTLVADLRRAMDDGPSNSRDWDSFSYGLMALDGYIPVSHEYCACLSEEGVSHLEKLKDVKEQLEVELEKAEGEVLAYTVKWRHHIASIVVAKLVRKKRQLHDAATARRDTLQAEIDRVVETGDIEGSLDLLVRGDVVVAE